MPGNVIYVQAAASRGRASPHGPDQVKPPGTESAFGCANGATDRTGAQLLKCRGLGDGGSAANTRFDVARAQGG